MKISMLQMYTKFGKSQEENCVLLGNAKIIFRNKCLSFYRVQRTV